MKLFLDRNKTLLPRIDMIYLLSRVMVLLGIGWFAFQGSYPPSAEIVMRTLVGTYAAHLIFLWGAVSGRFDIKLAYFSTIIYDLLMAPLLITYSGSADSSFYILFYLTVSVAAYMLTFWFAASVTTLAAVGYTVAVGATRSGFDDYFNTVVRLGFLVAYFLAITYSSQYLRKSERRLMKLLDTLNRRTSELEQSQSQLKVIYENSRILAAILDPEGIFREVTRLIRELLQLDFGAVILRDQQNRFFYRARLQRGRANFRSAPLEETTAPLLKKLCDSEESKCLGDLSPADGFTPTNPDSRSAMLVPIAAHGVVRGLLSAESPDRHRFGERDVQMLSVVARSAALALDNAELHKKTEELTVFDELTQTYNYRYFARKLDEERRRAFRYDMPLSLLMVDIDHFKKLNDTYGHENGNRVLRQLSTIIKSCIRDVDTFARYGGEEFVVILPQTPLADSHLIGERIRQRVESTEFRIDGAAPVNITVSVGLTSFPENGRAPQQLVDIADQALYQAKGDGRNLVRVI